MAPARTANRRGQRDENNIDIQPNAGAGSSSNTNLFLEPVMGTPLTLYVAKDVDNRDTIVNLITVSTTRVTSR